MLIYRLLKPQYDGQTVLRLTPMEFLDRISVLMPLPRRHRHRYHGVLAPNAPLRGLVTERAGQSVTGEWCNSGDEVESVDKEVQDEGAVGSLFASMWAMLLARIYEINPLVCPKCGGEMRIIAFITDAEPIGRILRHIGELDSAPEISPARGPPELCLEMELEQDWDVIAVEPVPEYQFDQTENW